MADDHRPFDGPSYRESSPVAAAGRSTEQRIAAAAISVIGTQGFREASVSDIVTQANVTQAEFDALYADKEDCFLIVHEALRQEFLAILSGAFVDGDDWLDGLRQATLEANAYLRKDPVRGRFAVVEPLNAGDRLAAALDESLDLLVELVHAGRFELKDPDSVPRSAAESAVGSIWSTLVSQLRNPSLSEGEIVPLLLYFAIIPYKGVEVARREFERMRSQEFSED